MPVDHRSRKGEKGQQQRLYHTQHLAEHNGFSEIPLLQKGSRKKTEKEHRNLPCEVHQPQMQGGVRQAVDKPAHGHPLHPEPHERDRLACEEEAVVSVAKSSGHMVGCPVFGKEYVRGKAAGACHENRPFLGGEFLAFSSLCGSPGS
jgi:hypothetical protein